MGDCKNCKHWTESNVSMHTRHYELSKGRRATDLWGICDTPLYASKGGFNANADAADDTDLHSWTETAGTFGCKLWEPIEGGGE